MRSSVKDFSTNMPDLGSGCIIFQSCSSVFFCFHGQLELFARDHLSSLRFLSNSLSSPRFNLFGVARRCFLWFSVFIFARLILPFFPLFFGFWSSAKFCFNRPKQTLSMHVFGPRNSSHAFSVYEFFVWVSRPIDKPTYIYISCEISIEHPSAGLALLAQLTQNSTNLQSYFYTQQKYILLDFC